MAEISFAVFASARSCGISLWQGVSDDTGSLEAPGSFCIDSKTSPVPMARSLSYLLSRER
jgi:hypothetical protein